jgi:hypothetical protein
VLRSTCPKETAVLGNDRSLDKDFWESLLSQLNRCASKTVGKRQTKMMASVCPTTQPCLAFSHRCVLQARCYEAAINYWRRLRSHPAGKHCCLRVNMDRVTSVDLVDQHADSAVNHSLLVEYPVAAQEPPGILWS